MWNAVLQFFSNVYLDGALKPSGVDRSFSKLIIESKL